jgi:hypothetical protein
MKKFLVATLLFLCAASALAQPAPWYKWKSKLNGKEICTQTSPGDGWERSDGPFKDGRCEKRL